MTFVTAPASGMPFVAGRTPKAPGLQLTAGSLRPEACEVIVLGDPQPQPVTEESLPSSRWPPRYVPDEAGLDRVATLRFRGTQCQRNTGDGVLSDPQVYFDVPCIVRPLTGPGDDGVYRPQVEIAVETPYDGRFRWVTTMDPGVGHSASPPTATCALHPAGRPLTSSIKKVRARRPACQPAESPGCLMLS